MKVTHRNLRLLIRETLQQLPKGRLDPHAGHMSSLEASDPQLDYAMWARTNGYHTPTAHDIALYMSEKELKPDSLQVADLLRALGLGADIKSDVLRILDKKNNKMEKTK